MTPDEFIDSCRKVYFATEDFDTSTFILVNGGLYYVFAHLLLDDQNPEQRAAHARYRTICADNLASTLPAMDFFMPAKRENVQALLMGVRLVITFKPTRS
jgi:hypothetical protein